MHDLIGYVFLDDSTPDPVSDPIFDAALPSWIGTNGQFSLTNSGDSTDGVFPSWFPRKTRRLRDDFSEIIPIVLDMRTLILSQSHSSKHLRILLNELDAMFGD